MSDNIKVVVKVRPLISRELEDKLSYQWRVKNNTLYQLDSNGKESGVQFTFDKVYDETAQTADVYEDVAKPIVEAAIAGFNGTIFAYGQTSSGKTYTMSGTETSPGIIPLAVLNLFEQIKRIPDRDFLVRVSYIEIYNESLKDLLNGENDKMKIRDTLQGVKVDATEKFTSSPEEVMDIMREGDANRQIGATNMNEESSRSHSIFQITIESREHTEGEEIAGCVNVSQLNLVDLAGSERSGQTGATGKRFKEGTHINKSLSVLALVIKQLSEDPLRHANYRDSKLTRLLQNSLGGNAKTSIICAVTPAAVEETISTLQFANRAKAIKNKPEVNAVATDATKLQDLTKQLSKLQSELAIKNNIEQDNLNLLKQIQNLQKMILNGFGQRIDPGGARRKTWCAPRRMTISTSSLRPVDEVVESVQRFCTPSLKYNPLSLPTPRDFQPIQRPSQLPSVSEERAMLTPPPKDRKVDFNDEIIQLDSDDDSASNTSHCSPYHKCYNKSETPPCVLRKNAKMAEENLKDIVELTKRERLFNPDVVEYMTKLEQSTTRITKLEDEIESLKNIKLEKDSEIEQLKDVINQTKIEVQTFSSAKAELEARCKEYTIQLTDLEVSYETLRTKAKLREDELLSLLSEQTSGNKKPKEIISGKSLSRTFDKDFGNFMDMSKDISLVSDNDTSIDSSNNEPSGQLQRLVDELRMEIAAKNEGIVKLETELLQQKLTIQTLESTCAELRDEINKTNSKLQYTEEENCLLKSSIETLNSTINSQKENLESANNDIQSYNVVIKELQAKVADTKYDIDLNVSDTLLERMITNEEQFIANNENMRNIIHSFKIVLKTRNEEIEQLKLNQKNETPSSSPELLLEQLEEKEKQIIRLVEEAHTYKEQKQEYINVINKVMEDNMDLVTRADDLSSKLLSAEKQSSEFEKRVLELEKENKAYNNQLHEFNENHDKLLQNLKDFKSNITELEKEKEELCQLQRNLLDKDNLIAELKSKISSKDSIINSLSNGQTESQNYLYKWKSTITKLHQYLSDHTGKDILPADFTEDASIFEILSIQLNNLENSTKEIVSQKELVVANGKKLREEIEILQSRMESVIQDKNKIENDKENQIQQISQLKRDITQLENELAVANNNNLQKEVEMLQSQVESLIKDKGEIENDRENQLQLVIQLKNDIAGHEKDLAVANNNKLQEEIEILQSQIESLIQDKNKIESDRSNQIQQVVQLKKEISELEKELCEINKRNEDLNQKLLLVNQSHDILQNDIIEKDNVITSIKNEENNLRSQLEKLMQLDVISRSEIENLQTVINTNEARFNEILKVKSDEVIQSKRDACRNECLFDEICKELQKLSKTLEETVSNRDEMLNNIYKAAIILIRQLENRSNESESIENIEHSKVYNKIIQILNRIRDNIESSNFQNPAVDNCEFQETVELLDMMKEQNHQLMSKLAYIENENSTLIIELEQIRIDNQKMTNDLSKSDEVLQQLQVELQEKVFIIENLECKINEWKQNFTALEGSMKQQLLELRISNSELESRSQTSMKNLSIHSSETYTIEPGCPDLDGDQIIRKSLNNLLVEPGNYSPQSLLTLCCNKIVDAIQPSDTEPDSVASSSNTNFTPTLSAETQTDPCDCERLLTEKSIVLDENLDLEAKVDFLETININLLKEQEEIRKELKLLVGPANELQKKISSHRTNLSTLTATTYTENKLLKSQVKVLQHHNNRIYNVCQRDLPAFKKSLQELSTILKHTPLVNKLETSIKRFSLPEVLDKNNSVFKDESTLDGDLLMLDTNVTVASVDNTLLVQDQTCLDGTQSYLETDINTDVIETIDPNVLHTQLQMLSVENERLSEKINVLKEENLTLHNTIEKLSENVRPDIRTIDTQSSPIKLDNSLTEVPQVPTANKHSTENLCEYCNNSNIHSIQEKLNDEINILTQELIEVRCQKSDFEKKCNDLNEDIKVKDLLVSKISALEQDNKKQLNMINKLTNKLSSEHEALTKLQEENDSLSTQLMEIIDESDSLRKELDSLKESNKTLSVKCADFEELLKGNTVACVRCARNKNTPDMNKSPLNRSRSDSESSSRCNKLSTLQNELLAGREDCRTISEDVATIKNHLERGNLSISHNMDLDDSMGEANVFSFPKELDAASPKPNSFNLVADIPEERSVDKYALDKAECFNYYIEKTGTESNITEEVKIIDLMKMFYNNLIAKHGNEIENLVNKLKDFEEAKNHLNEKLDSITSEYAKNNEEIKEKDNRIACIANTLDQIKNNIHNMEEEIVSCDADKNTVLVTMFKNNILNIFDKDFELSSVNVFENLIEKVVNKHQNDLLEMMNRYSELQGHMELLTSELKNVTDNLNQIKCQLSEKEQEYNLLKAQKEKVHEITSAVTLDIVQREQELTKMISNGCQKLVEYNILSPDAIDSSEPVDKKMSVLIEKFINQSKQSYLVFQEKHNLTLEVTKAKTALEEKYQELELLKCEVEKLRELSRNATKELLIKNEALQTQKSLHEQLDEVYQKKVEENEANARIVENLAQELDLLKVTVSEKENLLQSLQLQNNKQTSEDSETKAKIMELMESINSLEHENKNLKSVNDMITNESEQNAAQLAQADDTIKKNKTELDKLTAEILTLNQSLKESVDVIESLKLEAKSLVEQNVTLKKQFEEANQLCSQLKLNIKTHEKSAEIQCKIISRLKKEKESTNSVDSEKQKAANEMSEQFKSLQKDFERLCEEKTKCEKEARELKETKESLEHRVAELETQIENVARPRGSLGTADTRRRRQSLLDSKRTFSEEKLDTDHKKIEAYFTTQEKPEDLFMDVDDHSNRSTPARNRRSDSFQSRNDESEESSRPSSALARRRRRQSIYDSHRQTHPEIQDPLKTLDERKVNGDSQDSEVSLKERLQACQQELEELKERYREVDEECETCAEYLRERDDQCIRLRIENKDLQQQITELNNKLLNASVVRKQKDAQRTFANAAVNTDEDWANLHSVVVDRMSFDREVEKNKTLQRSVDELRFKNGELKATLAKMQKTAERAARNKANLQELEAIKLELKTCKRELEEYKERCKELDEECETCGEYLRERDEQMCRLKEERDILEAKLLALQEKEAGNKAQSVRKKRQSMHDQNRNSAVESQDASTETSVDFASLHAERDNLKLMKDSLQNENLQLRMALESVSQQKHAAELQLRAPALPPVYVATGSAIVQNQHLTEVMKENQKLKKMNAKLINICKKRGKPLVESNRENDDPADMG